MINYILRDYDNKDYKGLMDLWINTHLGSANRGDSAEIINHSIELGGKLIILENRETNEIFGSSWMTFDGRRIHLHHIGVKSEYQNQGFGKILTKESLNFAKEKNYQIKLEVHQSNKKAIEIYKKLGFAFLGEYDVYIVRDLNSIKI